MFRAFSTLAAGLALCAATLPPAAHAQQLPPAELFYKRPAVQAMQLSPSGRRLAFTADYKDRVGAFVIDLQQKEFKITAAASFSNVDVRRLEWVDDERLVFSVVDLQEGLGEDYRIAPGLYGVRYDGSELLTLVERRSSLVTESTNLRTALPVNHGLLHVPTRSEDQAGAGADEVIIGRWDFWRDELAGITPMWLNTRTGRTRSMQLDNPPERVHRWIFSSQGEARAAMTSRDGRDTLHWYQQPRDGKPGRWVQLAEGPQYRLPFEPAWVGKGETLYVTHPSGPRGEAVLAPFDFAAGKPGPALVVTPGFDFTGRVLGSADGNAVGGVRIDTDAEQTIWFNPVLKALQQRADAALPGRINRLSCRRCDKDDAVVLVRSWSDRNPGQVLLWHPGRGDDAKAWEVISTLQPGIDPQRMATVDFERIKARDGREVPVWITKPAGFKPGEPRPTVMLVHGGPWVRIGHWGWDADAQFLASRGYLVIEPEFRGSEGYGAAHRDAGNKQWGQAMQDDVTDALRWAQAQKLASDKACIVGGSYGGYSTLMGLIKDPGLYRCGSAWYAVADMMLFVDGSWWVNDDVSDSGRRYVLRDWVGHPERDKAMLLANSPVEQAARIRAPVQLIYGSEDKRVPIAHGERMRRALQKAGVEPEWIVYDGEGHGLRKLANRIDFANKLEAFLSRHLK